MKVTIETPPVDRVVVVEMSEEVAQTLLIVCDNVGGSVWYSRRRNTDALAKVLTDAGIKQPTGNDAEVESCLYFTHNFENEEGEE